jgi:hypothetical protein
VTVAGAGPPHRRAVVVELAGLPGAGKSSTATALTRWLTDRGVPVVHPQRAFGPAVPVVPRVGRKLAVATTGTLRSPGLSARMARSLLRSGQPGAADVVARFVQWHVNQRVLVPAATPGAVTLVDEGLVQSLWSIGLRGRVEPALEVLTTSRRWRAPDVLVVVRTPPDVAEARLAARASRHSRTQSLPRSLRLAELERSSLLLDRLLAWWDGLGPDPHLRLEVRGTGPADEAQLERIGRLAVQLSTACPP